MQSSYLCMALGYKLVVFPSFDRNNLRPTPKTKIY